MIGCKRCGAGPEPGCACTDPRCPDRAFEPAPVPGSGLPGIGRVLTIRDMERMLSRPFPPPVVSGFRFVDTKPEPQCPVCQQAPIGPNMACRAEDCPTMLARELAARAARPVVIGVDPGDPKGDRTAYWRPPGGWSDCPTD